jgi:hypothetical protein
MSGELRCAVCGLLWTQDGPRFYSVYPPAEVAGEIKQLERWCGRCTGDDDDDEPGDECAECGRVHACAADDEACDEEQAAREDDDDERIPF